MPLAPSQSATAAGDYTIQGGMPFAPAGNPYQGGGIGNLGAAYQQSYSAALEQNKALYGDILAGYQQTMGNQVGAQGQIQQGYGNLTGQVLGGIQGIGASQAQNIQDVYAQQKGAATQSLTSRGLGNTTVRDSVNRGLTLDESKAQTALANQIAATNAGYQSQLGLAGLNYGNQAAMQNTGQANSQLGWMNTVQAQYPNASAYNQLAQMSGQFQQANADRGLLQKQASAGRASVGAGAGVSGAGFKSGGSGTSLPMGLYQHALMPETSFTGGGGSMGFSGPSFTGGIGPNGQMPQQQSAPEQFDTYDLQTQQGYNTNDPGYQGAYGNLGNLGDMSDLSGLSDFVF